MAITSRARDWVRRRLAAFLAPEMPGLAAELDPRFRAGEGSDTGVLDADLSALYARQWQASRNREERHKLRDRMAVSALISKALDVIADVATAPEDDESDARSSFKIQCEDERTAEAAEQLVDSLKLRPISWGVARRLALYGNEMREVVVDPIRKRVTRYKWLPEQQIWRRTDQFGVPKDPPWEQRTYYQADGTGIPFQPWQVIHYKYGDDDETYGAGILQCEREFVKLMAIEDAMVDGRLLRSPSRLVHYVPVTQSKGAPEVRKELRAYAQSIQRQRILDATYGSSSRDNPTNVQHDFFMPYYGEEWKGARIDVLDPNNVQLTNIRDVEYLRGIVLARLGVPMRYLNLGGAEAARASLGAGGIPHEDRQFARTICRVQSVVAEGHSTVILYDLVLEGLDPIKHPVTIRFAVISTENAELNAKIERTRAETLKIISQILDLPPAFIFQHYMGLTSKEQEQFFGELGEAIRRKHAGLDPLQGSRHLKEIAASVLVMAESIAKEQGVEHGRLPSRVPAGVDGGDGDGVDYPGPVAAS